MINIFQEKYSSLFCEEGACIYYVGDIMCSLDYSEHTSSKHVREVVLEVIELLFNYNMIFVSHWMDNNEDMKEKIVTVEEAVSYLREVWLEDYTYEDLHDLPTFFYKDWYINKLRELNINKNTDWDWFNEEVIPQIEVWAKNEEGKNFNVNES